MYKRGVKKQSKPYVMGVPRLWFPLFFKFIILALCSLPVSSIAQRMSFMHIPYRWVATAFSILLLVLAYVYLFRASTLLQYRKMVKNRFIPCPLCGYPIEDSHGYRIGDEQLIICSECGCSTTTELAYRAWRKLLGKKAFRNIPMKAG